MAYVFTKNFDSYLIAQMGYYNYNDTANETNYLLDNNVVFKKFNAGSSTSSSYYFNGPINPIDQGSASGLGSAQMLIQNHGLTVGNGTGQVGYYDYQMESGSTILFSFMDTAGSNTTMNNYDLKLSQNVITSRLTENSKEYLVITFQLRNDGNDTKNISEIAFAPRMKAGSSSLSSGNRVLIFHEIFDQAVSVGPGDYFTYENKIELPNFRPNKPTT